MFTTDCIIDGLLSQLLPDLVADYAAECSSLLLRHQLEEAKKKKKKKKKRQPDVVSSSDDFSLLSSAVEQWLVPLSRRIHGRVALKRVRLRCQCSNSSRSLRPCSKLQTVTQLRQRRINFFDSS